MNASFVKKTYPFLFFVLFVQVAYAQQVATINGKPIDSREFLWVYKKNHTNQQQPTTKDLTAYLNLYINFKLKVAEAKAQAFDLDTAYQQEIKGYEEALKAQNKIPQQSAEYGYIMNEYREGVLMFNICEQKIWNKAQEDETKLQAFYQKNAAKYGKKGFEEIKGQLIGDYQQKLEEDWIKDLRKKYTVKINNVALQKLTKE